MHVVLINHRYFPFLGGSERHIQETAERLVVEGHGVRVVTSDAWDLEYFWDRRRRRIDAPARETRNGVDIRRVHLRHIPASSIVFQGGRRLMGELSRLPVPASLFEQVALRQPWLPDLTKEICDGRRPDVVIGTNIGLEGLAIAGQRIARRSGAAFVFIPFIHLGRDDDAVARRYVSMPHQRKLMRGSDAVVAMTEMEAAFLVSVGVDPSNIVVAGAGMTPEDVSGGDGDAFRQRYGVHHPLVVSLGALAPDKGTMDLVQAVARLNRSGRRVDLALAGPALSTFERWYTALDEQDRLGTHLLGVISPDEKRDMLDAADIVALPSRTESFGIVYVEAWANRKPVIAANAGAVSELVLDEENGLLVPFGDVPSIARAIERLLDDPALAAALGRRGFTLATTRYTWAAVHDRMKHAIEIALRQPQRSLN